MPSMRPDRMRLFGGALNLFGRPKIRRVRCPVFRDASLIAGKDLRAELRSRSVFRVLGTSALFVALVLAAAARIFCRRDF